MEFILSEGQVHDVGCQPEQASKMPTRAPQGRILMDTIGKQKHVIPLIMDRGYEDNYTRYIAQTLNFKPIVPPKSNRRNPWEYDRELYKRRNEIERLFRLIKGFRRVFTRFEKLDIMFIGFIQLALVYLSIR